MPYCLENTTRTLHGNHNVFYGDSYYGSTDNSCIIRYLTNSDYGSFSQNSVLKKKTKCSEGNEVHWTINMDRYGNGGRLDLTKPTTLNNLGAYSDININFMVDSSCTIFEEMWSVQIERLANAWGFFKKQ